MDVPENITILFASEYGIEFLYEKKDISALFFSVLFILLFIWSLFTNDTAGTSNQIKKHPAPFLKPFIGIIVVIVVVWLVYLSGGLGLYTDTKVYLTTNQISINHHNLISDEFTSCTYHVSDYNDFFLAENEEGAFAVYFVSKNKEIEMQNLGFNSNMVKFIHHQLETYWDLPKPN